MSDDQPRGRGILIDPNAASADPVLPAFLARPAGAPAYHGFPLIEESRTEDGWCFGSITEYNDPNGVDFGDAFGMAGARRAIDNVGRIQTGFTRRSPPDVSVSPENRDHGYLSIDEWAIRRVCRLESPVFLSDLRRHPVVSTAPFIRRNIQGNLQLAIPHP